MGLLRSLLGGARSRRLARYEKRLAAICAAEPGLRALPDCSLRERSAGLRQRALGGTRLDELLVEAFATGREAARRTLGMRHFDVQILGAMALHDGLVAEMKTGEGKTLAATLAVYLNALRGRGVHVVTVNDYLAARDAEWMGPLYDFLGLSVGVILENMGDEPDQESRERKRAYASDVTYGTNHEIAFDYLRDNLATGPGEITGRGYNFAIVDEVDFLLVDEARTPLIISGPSREDSGLFKKTNEIVKKLKEDFHYTVEAKTRTASLTERGFSEVQSKLAVDNLVDPDKLDLYHAVVQSLLAHGVYRRDVDYIVEDGEVFIVDEFTGRISEDKRYSNGLHQAIEAKEGAEVQPEDVTVAKVTYQTFFGRYEKLAGMTGTAWSERREFMRTYKRDVQVIPTNRPMIRTDWRTRVYDDLDDKHSAVMDEILEMRAEGRPVLVGSTSVKESEQISSLLQKAKVEHSVLNAKNHRREALIVANAGRKGAVTISTNMAGRGTDIMLGGNPEVIATQSGRPEEIDEIRRTCTQEAEEVARAGGLHVIGTGKHESLRIDNQLRGRAGRQGDPGSSRFFVSLGDEIFAKFGKQRIESIRDWLQRKNHPAGEAITAGWVLSALNSLQRKVDAENEAMRQDVLKYDLVIHVQRETIYRWRHSLVTGEGFRPEELIGDLVSDLAARADSKGLCDALSAHFQIDFELDSDSRQPLEEQASARALEHLRLISESTGVENFHELGRHILLDSIDELWTDHLTNLERLEDGIGLRGYAQVDPVNEWRREATNMWDELLWEIRSRAVSLWFALGTRAVSGANE